MTKTTPFLIKNFPKSNLYKTPHYLLHSLYLPLWKLPHSLMALLLSLSLPPTKPPQNHNIPKSTNLPSSSKRDFFLKTTAVSILSLTLSFSSNAPSFADTPAPSKSILSTIANTKSWFQFFGNGFSIRVPPDFQDIMEPEDYSTGLSLYGDKVKPKTYAARFASPDGSEVLSVVIRSTNQLKITFLEAKDITDLGTLKTAAKFFVPGGATLYSARTIKIKEAEGIRTYYFYEFGIETQHIAIVVAVSSGKAFIAGATAPSYKWEEDGVKLRSAAVSLIVQ